MKLYSAKIPIIAEEMIAALVKGEDIEVSSVAEAQLDIEAVLKEYLRMDRECSDKAKDLLEERHLDFGQFGKIKRTIAEERGFALGEEGGSWITTQIVESFMQSAHIEEVYADDATLRRKIKDLIKKHTAVEDELDQEVRRRIKNLEQGTATWEIEYQKAMDQIKRKHGLE